MLNRGDCVVYGNHGLCEVKDILVPSFLERGKEKEYYQMISAVDAGSVLYVPVDGAEDKVRDVIAADEAEDLVMRFGISNIPCLILFKGGEEVDRSIGFIMKSKLEEFISQ